MSPTSPCITLRICIPRSTAPWTVLGIIYIAKHKGHAHPRSIILVQSVLVFASRFFACILLKRLSRGGEGEGGPLRCILPPHPFPYIPEYTRKVLRNQIPPARFPRCFWRPLLWREFQALGKVPPCPRLPSLATASSDGIRRAHPGISPL